MRPRGIGIMWFLLQSSIIFAVVASNIRWQWTPNGYLASLIGIGLAWSLTRLLSLALIGYQTTGQREKRISDSL
jgi:hypothetical protein